MNLLLAFVAFCVYAVVAQEAQPSEDATTIAPPSSETSGTRLYPWPFPDVYSSVFPYPFKPLPAKESSGADKAEPVFFFRNRFGNQPFYQSYPPYPPYYPYEPPFY